MWDGTRNAKHANHQGDYTRIKKTIQEIVAMSKSKKKNHDSLDRSENLMKQFLELKKFQKGLAAATLDSSNRVNRVNSRRVNKSKDYTEPSSGESERGKGSMFSSSISGIAIDEKTGERRATREEYNTDELSDTSSFQDSEQVKVSVTEGSASEETDSEVSLRLALSARTQEEASSFPRTKKKSTLSPSELAIIKDLCRDLIKKEEKMTEDRVNKQELPIEAPKAEQYYKVNSGEESDKTEPENEGNLKYDIELENFKKEKYNIEPDNTKNQSYTTKPENNLVMNCVIVESPHYESISKEQTSYSATEHKEIIENTRESNEEMTNTLIVKGELTLISEQKEDMITTDEMFEKVHLEIVTKETVEEVDEWKQRIEEKVVIQKTVKVNVEEAEVTGKEMIEVEKETKELALCNMSDDDLIRNTIREADQASPRNENDYYYYAELSDRDDNEEKNRLQERIDCLQQQINSLRMQVEEAKRQNEEEAKQVGYLSAMMADREASLLPNGLDWDEWELKEMLRERLLQRRQAAAQDYEAKLRVVDALCSAEMGKLEEAFQTLVPLNATVTAWDNQAESADVRSSWQTQDYFFEVVTSMNLSSSDENGISGTISTNDEQPSLTGWKAEVIFPGKCVTNHRA
ncbi:uncharacterized protein [Halyomorpha halys]|uniref:uncharacterized protein isoform X2 n=1 Tax=Halyomorpha halys TaxID=286706 RepID=UPI0006D4CA2B|nr:uncharacterized protein LOC106682156 isoform X2 [Halyomorpha halys]